MTRFKIVSIKGDGEQEERDYPFGEAVFRKDYAKETAQRMNNCPACKHYNSLNKDQIHYEIEIQD